MPVEGYREIEKLYANRWPLLEFWHCEEFYRDESSATLANAVTREAQESFAVSKAVFKTLSIRENPDGLLAITKQPDFSLDRLPFKQQGFYLVVEKVEKPGNLGSMLRTLDAVGAEGLVLIDEHTEILNPNVIRASIGTVFSVPIAKTGVDGFENWTHTHGVKVVGTSPSAKTPYVDCDMTGATAVLIGSESDGLSDHLTSKAQSMVSLPSMGSNDSLNAAMTATVMSFEAYRQKNL